MKRFPLVALIFLAASAFGIGVANTHPHIWIETNATFVFKKGKVVAIDVRWEFDPMFSSAVMSEFDKNKNKRFDATELLQVKTGAFDNLKNFGYFTHPRVGGELVKITEVRGFKPSIKNGKVVYRFTVPLPKPVDPAATPFTVSFYDKTFYIDVGYAKKTPVRLTGRGASACGVKIGQDKKNPIYFGMVFPQIAILSCPGT